MPSQTTGDRLKALLQAKNWTVAYAVEKTGVSESTISRIINNRSNGISTTTLQLLCKGLDCTPTDILGHEPEQPSGADPVSYMVDTLRLSFNDRVLSMTESHISELDRLEKAHDKHIKDLKFSRNIWAALSFILLAVIGIWFIWDITHPRVGLIQYDSLSRLMGFRG